MEVLDVSSDDDDEEELVEEVELHASTRISSSLQTTEDPSAGRTWCSTSS